MKTKFFLPVLTMLSLILFSFTTNTVDDYSIRLLANGNYALNNVPLSEEEIHTIDQLAERISIHDQLNEETAARGSWIYRNKTWDDNRFTEKTLAGKDVEPILNGEDIQLFEEAREKIHVIMSHYMRNNE